MCIFRFSEYFAKTSGERSDDTKAAPERCLTVGTHRNHPKGSETTPKRRESNLYYNKRKDKHYLHTINSSLKGITTTFHDEDRTFTQNKKAVNSYLDTMK